MAAIDSRGQKAVPRCNLKEFHTESGNDMLPLEACQAGRIERVYQPGHPHAFVSIIYVGEVALCRVL